MNTYDQIGNAHEGWLFMRLLSHALPVLVYEQFALHADLPENQTRLAQFQRLKPFPDATAPLVEGTPPAGNEMEYETVNVVVQSYGAWVPITDQVDYHSLQNVLGHAVGLQGEQIGSTIDAIYHDVLTHGSNVAYGGGQTARNLLDQTDALNVQLLRAMERQLMAVKTPFVNSILGPGPGYESYAVDAGYISICHTDLYSNTLVDLASTVNPSQDGFKRIADYGTREPISPHEMGTYSHSRFICTPQHEPWRGQGATAPAGQQTSWQNSPQVTNPSNRAFDVYPILMFGREAYGGIAFRGDNLKTFVKNVDNSNIADPIGQKGYAAWKLRAMAAAILNQPRIRRAEVPAAL